MAPPVRIPRVGLPAAGVLALVLLGTACGSSQRPRTGKYADDAQASYEDAMDEFRDEDCMAAEPLFRDIRRKYAYSRFAPLAELRIADCQFIDGKYAEAIQDYRAFVRNRPSHSEVPYARFRVAEAYYEQIPEDWFILAPAEEKDQISSLEALEELQSFVLDYTEDPRARRAQKMIEEVMTLLGRHEFYVAEYYYKRDYYVAAVARLNRLLLVYPGSTLEAEALLMLGRSFVELGDRPRAKQAFERLVAEHPRADEVGDARRELASLGG